MEFHRKLCSSHALFPQDNDINSDDADGLLSHTLSAVVLLNSPACAEADLAAYVRMWARYRQQQPLQATDPAGSLPTEHEQQRRHRPRCYFVCGDGAYNQLRRYLPTAAAATAAAAAAAAASASPLCDVVLGDMDSLSGHLLLSYASRPDYATSDERRAALAAEGTTTTTAGKQYQLQQESAAVEHLSFNGVLHDTVDAIPDDILQAIHDGCTTTMTSSSDGVKAPLLPIACQMSTDFDKCVQLLARLRGRFPADFVEHHVASEQPSLLLVTGVGVGGAGATEGTGTSRCSPCQQQSQTALLPPFVAAAEAVSATRIEGLLVVSGAAAGVNINSSRSSSPTSTTAAVHIVTAEEALDSARELSLLQETSLCCGNGSLKVNPTTNTTRILNESVNASSDSTFLLHTHVLPSVLVLGALGGRFDHEMAAVNTVAAHATAFHLMLVDAHNILFACWPGGVTTWLPMCAKRQHDGVEGEEGPICGLIPYGPVQQLETAGLAYDMVKGRRNYAECCGGVGDSTATTASASAAHGYAGPTRYDGITQTEQYAFGFGSLISTSNAVEQPVVTVDLRLLSHAASTATATTAVGAGPPTVITCNRVYSQRDGGSGKSGEADVA